MSVSPTFLLGGKAVWKETVRPPGCLLSIDTHHNLKKNMPLATERPGNSTEDSGSCNGTQQHPSLCTARLLGGMLREASGTFCSLYLHHVTRRKQIWFPWPSLLREAQLSTRVAPLVASEIPRGPLEGSDTATAEIPKSRTIAMHCNSVITAAHYLCDLLWCLLHWPLPGINGIRKTSSRGFDTSVYLLSDASQHHQVLFASAGH